MTPENQSFALCCYKCREANAFSRSVGFTFVALVVMCHLQAGPSEAALDVEALVGLAAVQDSLVAANLLGDVVERLDDAQAQLLALLVLGNGDVLDMAYEAEAVDAVVENTRSATAEENQSMLEDSQLALDYQRSGADDLCAAGVVNDEDVVAAVLS